MKDTCIKHIRQDFHIWPGVMPQGWDLGYRGGLGGGGGIRNSTRFGAWVTYMNATCNGVIVWVPAPWGLGEGPKGQISLNLNYKVNFKDFLTKLCVSSHKWKIYNISDKFSFGGLGHAQGCDLGVPGGLGGGVFFFWIQPGLVCELLTWMEHAPAQFFGSTPPVALGRDQKFNFLNMVGRAVDQDTLKIFNPWSNWWPWDGIIGPITIIFLRERGDLF